MFNRRKIKALEAKVEEVNAKNRELISENFTLNHEIGRVVLELDKLRRESRQAQFLTCNVGESMPMVQRIIKAGRAKLLMTAHPDHGGTREEMEAVETAFNMLKNIESKTQEYEFESPIKRYARMQREAMDRARQATSGMGGFWDYGQGWR